MIQEGFLIISDISGYSSYLNESELEHARDSLTDLLSILVDHAKSPLVISKLEGDAVFSYVKKGGILQSQTMVEIIETTYAAFRKALDLMIINTTCNCNACRNLPKLDLKFFVHYGQFSTQRIGNYTELVGNDVNLVHRLLKNSVKDEHAIPAYAAFTHPAVNALESPMIFETMAVHVETYPDVGEVKCYIQNLHHVWDQKKNTMRVVVTKDDALLTTDLDYPVPPMMLWEYLTKPDYRAIMTGADSMELTNKKGGRAGVDAVYVCAHGDSKTFQTIVDWEPFEQYTTHENFPLPGISANLTYRIAPTETGSRLSLYWGKAMGNRFWAALANLVVKTVIVKMAVKTRYILRDTILREIEEGKTAFEPSIRINPDLISAAVEDEFVSQGSGKKP